MEGIGGAIELERKKARAIRGWPPMNAADLTGPCIRGDVPNLPLQRIATVRSSAESVPHQCVRHGVRKMREKLPGVGEYD